MNTVRFPAVLCLCGCLLLGGPAVTSAQEKSRKIIVNGSAMVNAKPDAARLNFFVHSEAANNPREVNDRHVKKLKDQLMALALANVDIQIIPYAQSTIDIADMAPNGEPPARLQHVQTQFTVLVRETNVDKLRTAVTKIVDTATNNGARATPGIDDPARMPRPGQKMVPIVGPKIEWLSENTRIYQQEAVKRGRRRICQCPNYRRHGQADGRRNPGYPHFRPRGSKRPRRPTECRPTGWHPRHPGHGQGDRDLFVLTTLGLNRPRPISCNDDSHQAPTSVSDRIPGRHHRGRDPFLCALFRSS